MKQPLKIHLLATIALSAMIQLTFQPVFAADQLTERSVNLRLSVGNSWQTRNDVQIPNTDMGTRFSLEEAVGAGPVGFARIEVNWAINSKHGIRVLLAPLSYSESVTFNQPILFMGESFNANQLTDATYRFNSWRVGYHYLLKKTDAVTFRVGATLKVRDAEIRLVQGDTVSFDDNVGIVPLLYLAGTYRLNDRLAVGANMDALAGGPGRAIDLGVTMDYAVTKRWQVGAELRVLDGGAATDSVYNFARFNSAAIVLSTNF